MPYRFFSFFRPDVSPAFFAAAFFAAALTACNNDDDSPDLPPGAEYPLILDFEETTDEVLHLYVGGVPADTDGLSPEDLFTDAELLNFTPDIFENQAFIFTEDSLIGPGFPNAVPYYLENDTLYATVQTDPGLADTPVATGDLTALRLPRGAYKYCITSDNLTTCSQGEGFAEYTAANIEAGISSIPPQEIFGPDDSLAVYSIVLRFTPR